MSLEETPPSKSRRLPIFLIAIGLLALLVLTMGVAIWGGYQSGLKQHQLQAQATRSAELNTQFDLGVADLSAGNNDMAQQRFEYILSIDPGYPGAADKLEEAQAVLQITSSPTPTPLPLPTVTPMPVATAGPTGPDPASILAQAEQSSAAKNWDDVIQKLSDLRALDAKYEPAKVDQLLFTALRNRGVARIEGKELEGGIFDLNQAETLAPLDTDAKSHRLWARYYLDAMSYWGLDWKRTVELLSELHTFAPYFQDSPARLYQAHLNYAAQLAAAKNFCDAAAQYAAAQALSPAPAVAEKQAAAQAQCVPTPVGETTGTPGTTPTAAP